MIGKIFRKIDLSLSREDHISMKYVLFVCIENSCRSQMAEAFAKMYGQGLLEAHSAGSHASGTINEKAIQSMRKVNYDLNLHRSKSIVAVPDIQYDFVITMGCGEGKDICPYVFAKTQQDWMIEDPKDMDTYPFNRVRDTIKTNVLSLIDLIQQ